MTTTLLVATLASNGLFPIRAEVEVGQTIRSHVDLVQLAAVTEPKGSVAEIRVETRVWYATGLKVGASLLKFETREGSLVFGVVVVRKKQ